MLMRLGNYKTANPDLVSTITTYRKEVFPCIFQSIGGKREAAQRADNTQSERRKKKLNN